MNEQQSILTNEDFNFISEAKNVSMESAQDSILKEKLVEMRRTFKDTPATEKQIAQHAVVAATSWLKEHAARVRKYATLVTAKQTARKEKE